MLGLKPFAGILSPILYSLFCLFAADLTTTLGIAQNTATLIIAAESGATVNTNYIGIYDAATGGTLLISGFCNVSGQTVTVGNPVVFSPLALNINLN